MPALKKERWSFLFNIWKKLAVLGLHFFLPHFIPNQICPLRSGRPSSAKAHPWTQAKLPNSGILRLSVIPCIKDMSALDQMMLTSSCPCYLVFVLLVNCSPHHSLWPILDPFFSLIMSAWPLQASEIVGYISTHKSYIKSLRGIILSFLVYRCRNKFKETQWLAHGHIVSKCQNKVSNTSLPTPRASLPCLLLRFLPRFTG